MPGRSPIVGTNRLRGTATAGGFCGTNQTFQIHFALEFDTLFTGSGTWREGTISPGSTTTQGTNAGA